MPEPTVQMPEPAPSMRATLHITPAQVQVHDLSRPGEGGHFDDLVSLELGTPDVGVSLLGTLDVLVLILDAAVVECRRVHDERKAAGR